VSGDSDLLVLEIIDGVRILNPADFHKEFVAT
jgi:predicted nucleic acid-binding protein